MRPLAYERAATAQDAVRRHAPGAAYLAGGTNLLDHLRLGITEVDRLIDIRHLPLTGIDELPGGGLRIGAMLRNSDAAAHPLVRQRFPFVSQALLSGASGQLRNMATIGGNLLQRTRCVYFQDLTTPCNKRQPGTGCSAREGFGTYNAVLGSSEDCHAVHPSDLCVPLAALDVQVVVLDATGERRIDFGDLHRLAGDTPDLDHSLRPGDLITAIEIAGGTGARSRYRKVRERASYAFALVSVAAALEEAGGVVSDVRLAFGGVSHKPHRARTAEGLLRGQQLTPGAVDAALTAELADAAPGHDNAAKIPILTNVVHQLLLGLRGQG